MMEIAHVLIILLFLVVILIASLCYYYTCCKLLITKNTCCKSIPSSVIIRTERPRNCLFKIESFSLVRQALAKTKRDKYDSLHFKAGGHKWKLSLYPNGDKKRGGDGYISLYLALVDPKSIPQGKEVLAIVNFFVYDHLRGNYVVLQDGKEKQFHSLNAECGFEKLLPLAIFNDPSKGYLVGDCCIFGVDVFLNKIERHGGLSLTKNDLDSYESSFTSKIDKFSTLQKMHKSENFIVGGVKWRLDLYPKGDSRANGKHISLYLCVKDHSSFPSGWSIYAEYKISILDQLKQTPRLKIDNSHWFTRNHTNWGRIEFMKLSDLNDASGGFIVNDTVVIEVKFIIISALNSVR